MEHARWILTLIFAPIGMFIGVRMMWDGWKSINSPERDRHKSIYRAEMRRGYRGVYLAMMIFFAVGILIMVISIGGLILQNYGILPDK